MNKCPPYLSFALGFLKQGQHVVVQNQPSSFETSYPPPRNSRLKTIFLGQSTCVAPQRLSSKLALRPIHGIFIEIVTCEKYKSNRNEGNRKLSFRSIARILFSLISALHKHHYLVHRLEVTFTQARVCGCFVISVRGKAVAENVLSNKSIYHDYHRRSITPRGSVAVPHDEGQLMLIVTGHCLSCVSVFKLSKARISNYIFELEKNRPECKSNASFLRLWFSSRSRLQDEAKSIVSVHIFSHIHV